jgi:hypothetical protein
MYFLFVDETGDPGKEGSKCFGLAIMQVHSKCYDAIRRVLFSYRLLSGMFPEVKDLPQKPIAHLNLLRGISSLAEARLIEISGLFIDKSQYGGRYLQWIDEDNEVSETEWPYYLRNYLLRHLLEMHYEGKTAVNEDVDLVLDRVMLTEAQRGNTLSYLNSKTHIPLRQPFAIPPIKHLTIADSKYVGALQLVHIVADVIKNCARGKLTSDQKELMASFKIAQFIGHRKPDI